MDEREKGDRIALFDLVNSARLGNFGQIFSMRELEAFDRFVEDPDECWGDNECTDPIHEVAR